MDAIIIFSARYLIYLLAVAAIVYISVQFRDKAKEIFYFAIPLFILSYAIAKIAGYFFFDPRPFAAENFDPLIPHAANNGFPSDHTLLAAATAAAVFRFDKKIGAVLFLFALVVGLARILAGVHHAIDILASLAIVFVVYTTVKYFFEWIKKRR